MKIPPHTSTAYPLPKPSNAPKMVGLERMEAQVLTGDRLTLLKQLGVNFRRSLVQDTAFFKMALAPIASALLVLTRVAMALHSAKKERANSDEEKAHYAKEQALMTITREVAGFGLSYGLMSVLNIAMDKPIQRLFGFKIENPDVTGPVKALSQGIQILAGHQRSIHAAPFALGSGSSLSLIEEKGASPNWIQKGMRQLLPFLALDSTLKTPMERLKAGAKNVHHIGVPLISAGISVYLAGWVLERTALLKTDVIIEKLKAKRQHMKDAKANRLSNKSV